MKFIPDSFGDLLVFSLELATRSKLFSRLTVKSAY